MPKYEMLMCAGNILNWIELKFKHFTCVTELIIFVLLKLNFNCSTESSIYNIGTYTFVVLGHITATFCVM